MKTKVGLGKILNFAVLALAFTSTQAGSAVETSVTYDVIDITTINSNLEPKIGVTGVSADGSVVLGWYRTGMTEDTWAENHFIWKDGELTSATLHADPGGSCAIRYGDMTATLETKSTEAYDLIPLLKK